MKAPIIIQKRTLPVLLVASALMASAAVAAVSGKNAKDSASVEQALQTWLAAVASHTPEKVAALYDSNAVLLPTLRNAVHDTPEERLDYFKMFTGMPKIKGTVNEQHPRLLNEDTAMNGGIYTFTFEQDGKMVTVPARFSFTYKKENGAWKIVEHHSSRLPEPVNANQQVASSQSN
jgi:uncharacterized protein (TIGR02246 family)